MQTSDIIGTFVVTPQCAKLSRDTETFGRMDPYVKVIVGTQQKRGRVHIDGGKSPSWVESFQFFHANEELIRIEVWDSKGNDNDDLIGEGSIACSTVIKRDGYQDWMKITYHGKVAGHVLFHAIFTPTENSHDESQEQSKKL